jgi:hypothetical protein
MISETFSSHFNPQPSPLETTQPALDLVEQIANQDTTYYLASQQEQETLVEEAKPFRKRSKVTQEESIPA